MAEKENKMLPEYDVSTRKSFAGEKINYGILYGSDSKIVFIKSGAGGKIRGKDNKYLKIAYGLRERLGATVICADNPDSEPEDILLHEKTDMKMISSVAQELKFTDYELYFIGTSDGGYHNMCLARECPQTVRLLGINPSMNTVKDFIEKLNAIRNIDKILVFGSNDECYKESVKLRELEDEKLKFITVTGADHFFTDMVDEFIALAELI